MISRVQTDKTVTDSIPFLPPTHRGGRYQDYFDDRPGEAQACDQLYFEMKEGFRVWQTELNRNSLWAHLDTLIFFVESQFHHRGGMGAEAPEFKSDRLGDRYRQLAEQYNQRCLPKLDATEATVRIRLPQVREEMRSMWDEAADGIAKTALQGGRFLMDHPWQVAGVACLGIALVFAPEAAPVLIAL